MKWVSNYLLFPIEETTHKKPSLIRVKVQDLFNNYKITEINMKVFLYVQTYCLLDKFSLDYEIQK